jgi:hypothetical protein
VAGGALPMSAGNSFHGRRKPNGSACQRRTMAGVQEEAKHARDPPDRREPRRLLVEMRPHGGGEVLGHGRSRLRMERGSLQEARRFVGDAVHLRSRDMISEADHATFAAGDLLVVRIRDRTPAQGGKQATSSANWTSHAGGSQW